MLSIYLFTQRPSGIVGLDRPPCFLTKTSRRMDQDITKPTIFADKQPQPVQCQVGDKDSFTKTVQLDTLTIERSGVSSNSSGSSHVACPDIIRTCCPNADKDSSTTENAFYDLNRPYKDAPHEGTCQVSIKSVYSPEACHPEILQNHCLNAGQSYKNTRQDSDQDAYKIANCNVRKRSEHTDHRVVIRVEDTGKASQQFWAAVDKTVVSNMVDQILTSAISCNNYGEERFSFDNGDQSSLRTNRPCSRREERSQAEAVWQHLCELNNTRQSSSRRHVSARHDDFSHEEDGTNHGTNVTCDTSDRDRDLGSGDVDNAYDGPGEGFISGDTNSTFKWKSNILRRVRIDQIMTSPAPMSDWRSRSVASPVAV